MTYKDMNQFNGLLIYLNKCGGFKVKVESDSLSMMSHFNTVDVDFGEIYVGFGEVLNSI